MFAAKTKGLAWRARRDLPNRLAIWLLFNLGDIGLFNRTLRAWACRMIGSSARSDRQGGRAEGQKARSRLVERYGRIMTTILTPAHYSEF